MPTDLLESRPLPCAPTQQPPGAEAPPSLTEVCSEARRSPRLHGDCCPKSHQVLRPHHGLADKRPRRLSVKGVKESNANVANTQTPRSHPPERGRAQRLPSFIDSKLQERPPQSSSKECVGPPIPPEGKTSAECAHSAATRCRALHRLRSRTCYTCPRLQLLYLILHQGRPGV
jgi:hypothetical protein